MAIAFLKSADLSTYTWQTPAPVSIVGTVASSTTERINSALPRGITKSTSPLAVSNAVTVLRSVEGIN